VQAGFSGAVFGHISARGTSPGIIDPQAGMAMEATRP
jgi:hypothetical protein